VHGQEACDLYALLPVQVVFELWSPNIVPEAVEVSAVPCDAP